ncbi:MAG: PadR family transcriptional regulator [Firmicutes bacterium]|nr:PadR family transcriptional regulator [Bacillota bacterium]
MDDKIIRELKRGTLEMVLLSLLSERQQYGYQLVSAIAERSDGLLTLAEGSLYPVLYRLEDAGLIEARWETQGRGVPRKYYCVTELGKENLAAQKGQWQALVVAMEKLLGGGS